MYILGISAFYHDSAICLVNDGEIVFAAQEERFSRIKHDPHFPVRSIDAALHQAHLSIRQIDHVAYYDKPLLTFERLLETWLAYAPFGFRAFMTALPAWLDKKLFLSREIDRGLQNAYQGPLHFLRHHQSHAASAFYPSPFQEAAILTMDGVGEWSTTTIGMGKGHAMELLKEIRFPHSLGLLYSAFTSYLGFRVNSGEYKVMGLAPYGKPSYADVIRKHLMDIKPDGSFWMDMRYFNYCAGLTMTNQRFHDLFGGPPRKPDAPLTPRDLDLAASVQQVCEETMLLLARQAKAITGADNLCLAGGCALNCVANGVISRERVFKNIFVQPAAGDAGGALGAALFAWHHILGNDRRALATDSQKGSLLGPEFNNAAIENSLRSANAHYKRYADDQIPEVTADLIEKGKVVGFFYGRMEFGPRALGARSILADARRPEMQSVLNLKIKFRESFRPFAPAILEEYAADYFDLQEKSPYMMLVGSVLEKHRLPSALTKKNSGLSLAGIPRSDIPAVTHVDDSARVQTVNKERCGLFYDVLKAFHQKTNCPVVINTSFNIRGEPIVASPEEAYRCFMFTDMDALVLQDFVLLKEDQPAMLGAVAYKQNHQRQD